jgi:tRNA A37 methylthiotransferase MiaB
MVRSLPELLSGSFAGYAIREVVPGTPAKVHLARDGSALVIRLLSPTDSRVYKKTQRFGVAYEKPEGAVVDIAAVDAFVRELARVEREMSEAEVAALFSPAESPTEEERRAKSNASVAQKDPPRIRHALEVFRHRDLPKSAAGRPLRIVLANLCQDSQGYGPGASEYLRAKLLSVPEIAEQVEITILFLTGSDTKAFAEQIATHDPDLVGFTCYSWNLEATAETTRKLREQLGRAPRGPVIAWGGCSFALLRERSDWFGWWNDIDLVAIGSGEQTIVDLAMRLLSGADRRTLDTAPIRGTIRMIDGQRVDGGPAVTPKSLLEVPSPYQLGTAFRVARPYVEMARGCTFQCAFCSDARVSREGLWLPLTRDRIAADIGAIARWSEVREIDAGSSTANVSEEHFTDVCEAIRLGDPERKIAYSLQMYPAIVRQSQRDALSGIRVKRIAIGAQSSSPETWKPMRRKTTLEHIRKSTNILRGVGPLYLTVILGLPGETYESFKQMMDDLLAVDDVSIVVHRLLALPGTQFHQRHEEFGIEFDPSCFYRVRSTSSMNNADLKRAQALVQTRAHLGGRTSLGERRIDWTNFDDQELAFDGAPNPDPSRIRAGAAAS